MEMDEKPSSNLDDESMGLISEETQFPNFSVTTDKGVFPSDIVLISQAQLAHINLSRNFITVYHVIIISQHPILDTGNHAIQLITVQGQDGVYAIQYHSDTQSCPQDTCKSL
jgi:hypothetical protein